MIRDHRLQEDLLEKLKKTTKDNLDEREILYNQFREELVKHISIEEKIFYPRLKNIPKIEAKVLEALEEHKLCVQLIQEMDCRNVDDKLWVAKLAVLKDLTAHHVHEEEDDLFPMVAELKSEDYLQKMGIEMKDEKKTTDTDEVVFEMNRPEK